MIIQINGLEVDVKEGDVIEIAGQDITINKSN